jgi:membrane-bound ClpP family serine protease
MAKDIKVLPIKKVVAILTVFWMIAGTIMLLTMHYSTRSLVIVCSMIAVVPTILGWVLVFVSLHLDKTTAQRAKKKGARRGGAVGRTGKGVPPTSKRS